ncbi:MAG: hypothetical protein ACPGXZ_01690 [Saprospiraceae bacterium]
MEEVNKEFDPEEAKITADETTEEIAEETAPKIKLTGVASVDWINAKWEKLQSYTKKQASDNIWVLGVKLFFQAIGILILIILSPFVLLGMMIALLVAG